ncbi:hypothetical protein [Paraburkholderia sp.]|jgi:hypothetical protein|uniref:hypothetical protein n=1 Tax=Paraburkholderia sp. TaxID=1926495 RepID=UPI002F3EFD30
MHTYPKGWLMAACIAVSGVALAQGGGNGNGGTGSGNAHGAATAAPTVGNEPASNAAGTAAGSTSTMKHGHHMSKSKKKPMTDSTNMPGANASSDTKGQ